MRIIAKLDVKSENVVKPVHFEGLRKMGRPVDLTKKYYEQGADEIFYIDIVASLYQREFWLDQIREAAQNIYVPFAVGGGIRSVSDISRLFHAGADKVVINTHALQVDPQLIDAAAKAFGSQAVVVNIEAKQWGGWWECYTDCGRIRTGRDVLDWAREVQERGAGEILIQSVDCDGRQRGFDIALIKEVVSLVKIPVVAASGAGSIDHIKEMAGVCDPSGVSVASVLHYDKLNVNEIKKELQS